MRRRGKGEGTAYEYKPGKWTAQVSLGCDGEGKCKRKTVYGKSQAEVLSKERQIHQQLADGTYGDTDLTVKAYLERWLKEKARTVKPLTTQLYRYNVEKYVAPRLGRVQLTKLTPLQVQSAISDIADKAGTRTANQARTVLFQAMKQAVKWQLVPRNVVEAVDKLKDIPQEMQLWTFEEAAHFLASIQSHRLYALFYLAMSTGMRRGELLGLRWQDVQEGSITICPCGWQSRYQHAQDGKGIQARSDQPGCNGSFRSS